MDIKFPRRLIMQYASLTCSVGFPRRANTWEDIKCIERSQSLDLLLECSRSECLHHGLCWLGRNLHLLAEHGPNAGFCGWLHAGLDAAKAWNGEDSVLLHLTGSNCHEAVEHIAANLLLKLVFFCKGCC